MIRKNIDIARSAVALEPIIDEALTVVLDVLESLNYFTNLLSPKGLKQLDQYCTGMVFGLHGS